MLFFAARLWLILTVLALVAMGFDVPPKRAFSAVHDLRFNHRIAQGDIAPAPFIGARALHPAFGRSRTSSEFVGRYVVVSAGIRPGSSIGFEQTAERPVLLPPAGRMIAWVPVGDAGFVSPSWLDAGDRVQFCTSDGKTCGPELDVGAVACSDDGKTCSAGLWVATGQRATPVLPDKARALRAFFHPKGAPR